MQIKDIMSEDIVSLTPDATLYEAAKLMKEYDIGVIPVCDESGIHGVLTDRDIVIRNVAYNGSNPSKTKIKDVMSENLTVVDSAADIKDVSRIMANNQVRRLPVMENDKLVGMVSLGDIAKCSCNDIEVADTLSDISAPSSRCGC